jgi:chaperonin cofactor prefoldin
MANTNGLSNEQLLSELEKRASDAENRLSVLERGNEGLWLSVKLIDKLRMSIAGLQSVMTQVHVLGLRQT